MHIFLKIQNGKFPELSVKTNPGVGFFIQDSHALGTIAVHPDVRL